MQDKEFIVTHAHARAPITVKGKTLEEALEKEGLDPAIWQLQIEADTLETPPETEPESLDNPE